MDEIIVDRLHVPIEEIKSQTNFEDDLGADSLDMVELIMDVEDKFDVAISDEDVEKIHTMRQLVDWLGGKLCS